MGDVGDKVAADVLQLAEVRHVVEHDHRTMVVATGATQGGATHQDCPIPVAFAEQQVVFHSLLAVDCPQHEPPQIGIPHHLLQRPQQHFARLDAEQCGSRRVNTQETVPVVDGNNALHHARQHRFLLRTLPANRAGSLKELIAKAFHGSSDRAQFGEFRCRDRGVE